MAARSGHGIPFALLLAMISQSAFALEREQEYASGDAAVLAQTALAKAASNVVALELTHEGIATNWGLDLVEQPTLRGHVCEERVLSLGVGPIRAIPVENRGDRLIERIIQSPDTQASWRSTSERYRMVQSDEECRHAADAHWTSAPDVLAFRSVSEAADELRQKLTAHKRIQNFYCSDARHAGRCERPEAELGSFLAQDLEIITRLPDGTLQVTHGNGHLDLIFTPENALAAASLTVGLIPPLP